MAPGAAPIFTDDFKTDPYWWEATPPRDFDGTTLPKQADVVVIGSGYTGLHSALQTARGGRDTIVLDAEQAGFGCSTRNGGQISTSIKPEYDQLARGYGPKTARAILEDGRDALSWIGEFVAAEGIDCHFKVAGRFHAAHNPAAYNALIRSIDEEQPDGLEIEAYPVAATEQRSELGTDAYFGGVVLPKHASLDPGRYHQGLLERVIEAGAEIVTHCPALAIERQGGDFVITTSHGKVRAGDIVLATNGYTGPVSPWQRRRLIPIGSYVIATEPLTPGLVDRLIPNDRVVSDTRRVVYYYRASPDRSRILFGGRVSHGETDPGISGPKLHAEMVRIFPELVDVRISHSWVGLVAYTFDTLAHAGVHDGIHYAAGYCGSGVSMASYLGMRIGQRVLGLKDARIGVDGIRFPTRPFYTGKPWFLAPSVMIYRLRDRLNF
ncbi:MAG: NAD(P)/FAD-dependent oxidoreductase [Geminicoccaceae bacterium]